MVLVIALFAALAPEPAELTLAWEAPPGCPQVDEVRGRVRVALGDRERVSIEAAGRVTQSDDRDARWQLQLRVADPQHPSEGGERVLVARSCEALTEAAVLVLAVAATSGPPTTVPDGPAIPVPPPVEPTPPAATTSSDTAALAPTPTPTPTATNDAITPAPARPRARVQGEVAIAGGFDAAAMPGLGGTVVGTIGLRWRWLGVHAIVLHGIRRDIAQNGVEARHSLLAGGLAVCALGPIGAFELGGCAKAELGGLRSEARRGRDLEPADTDLWAAGSLGALARWTFARRWALSLAADAVVPRGSSFVIGSVPVGKAGPIGVRLLAGIAVRFG